MRFAFILGILLLHALPLEAMEWTMHGALKNETAYFLSGQQRWDKIQNRIDLKPEAVLNNRWEFRGRFLAWYDAAMDVNRSNTGALNPGIKQHYRFYTRSKEAYLLYGGDNFDLRLGQQQIVWGKTDGLRMLDVINPLDMREFILDDFLDSRIGLWSARLNAYTDVAGVESEFELVFVPDARPVAPAPMASRWGFAPPATPPGVRVSTQSGVKPGWRPSDAEAGIAWRGNIDGWDLSLNWFYGWKDTPVMLKRFTPGLLSLTPVYRRMHTVGASFSNAFGAVVWRGELTANLAETLDRNGLTPATSTLTTHTYNAALGIDYTIHRWRVSPQVFVRYIPAWNNTVVEKQNSGFASLMLATDYLNEKLKPEVIALYDWSGHAWMMRPKLSYEVSDALAVRLGLDVFTGRQGFLGQFNRNDRITGECEYSF